MFHQRSFLVNEADASLRESLVFLNLSHNIRITIKQLTLEVGTMIFYTRTIPMVIATAAAAGCAFLSVEVEGFQPPLSQTSIATLSRPHLRETPFVTKKPLTIMYRIRCENKYYQLEELEDADNCTTELFLKEDGTVDIGETDGPLFTKAVGRWEIKENSFAMTMTKTFTTGNEKNDMGEFSFDVERVFEGDMTVVGGTEVAINGKIFAEDIITEKYEKEVGFFNMIDGTEQRLDRRADARPKAIGVKPSPINSNDVKGHDGIPREWLEPKQEVQSGISAFGAEGFDQDTQGFGGGGGGYGQQQQPASSWGTGSSYGQQQPQSPGISEYGGGSFGQESQTYGGGYGQQQQQQYNDPGPPSFADYGQPQQQEQYNDPGPPSFSDYSQEPQQEEVDESGYYNGQNNDGYYNQGDYSGYNGGNGLNPMGGGSSPNPWP